MTKIIPFLLINLSTESIYLQKKEVMGSLGEINKEICEIVKPTASEPLPLEVITDQGENVQEQEEGRFICSPTDISVHWRVDLEDAELSEEIPNKFGDLCAK